METDAYEQTVLDVVFRFLHEEQWNYQQIEGKPVIRAGFHGEHGTWVCFLRVDSGTHRLIFHSLLGMDIGPQYRAQVVEYITRVNHALALGNFEMDFDSGDVRFKTSVETPENELSVAMVRALAYANVLAIDHYFPGVMAVIHGGMSPVGALARIEPLPQRSAVRPL
jgi:hypothetical protein